MDNSDIQKLEENRKMEKLSIWQFCRQSNLRYSIYLYRLRKLKNEDQISNSKGFIELAPEKPSLPFVLSFPNGLRLEVNQNFEPRSLKRLIATLSS